MGDEGDHERMPRSVVAIIPARGGSKGVPRKNVSRVGGVPLVARAVYSALGSALIDTVIVSTDDAEIAAVSRAAGAEVVHRPAELSGDTAGSESALLHVLEQLDAVPDIVVFLQATSPFLDVAALDASIARVAGGGSDMEFSAVESASFLWRASPEGARAVNHDAATRPRRQDRETQYLETGAFYVMDARGFLEARGRFFGRIGIAVVEETTAIEIDSAHELAVARAVASLVDRPGAPTVDAVVTDFDGVHTDDRAHIDSAGRESVTVSRSDGMGVQLLRSAGIPVLILSRETDPIVSARAAKLRVEVLQGVHDKRSALIRWASDHSVDLARIAYLGNDVNDLAAMAAVGWPAAVADAHPEVRAAARVTLLRTGGHGAVRELADLILGARPGGEEDVASADPVEQKSTDAGPQHSPHVEVRERESI